MKMSLSKILLMFLMLASFITSNAQKNALMAGPMLGHTDMRETNIWVATQQPGKVVVEYWRKGEPGNVKTAVGIVKDDEYKNTLINVYGLEPGLDYNYRIKVGDDKKYTSYPAKADSAYAFSTEPLWQYRNDPPPFKFALGSCAFINDSIYDRPGKPYGRNYQTFSSIVKNDPDFMLWLGDNIYLREVDFESKSGVIYRYMHSRSIPSLSSLLAYCPNYAIWDDHDFGPNDSNGSFVQKDNTLEAFTRFWGNPTYGGSATGPGITTNFAYEDVEFFMLDNRFNRTTESAVGVEPTILGQQQIDWLITALKTSKATFKFIAIGGQVLSTEAKFENYAVYPKERQILLDLIEKNNIKGVVFLTGDRHCTELSALTLPNGNKVYDLTCSPLTSGAYDNTKENNTLRVEGTIVPEQNYGIIEITGPQKERKLTINIYTSTGTLAWTRTLDF